MDNDECEKDVPTKLTLNQAFIKIGGFGKFQILAVILFMILRDMGIVLNYCAAINFKE